MVAKKAAGVAGAGVGGFLNNPGAVAVVVSVVAILASLLLFQNDIRRFFGTSIPEAIGSIGDIQLPSFEFPDITFPSFEFPDITFPSLPDITFPDFNFSFPSLPELPGVPEPFVEPERQDVPFGDTDRIIDIVPEFGRADPRRPEPEEPRETIEELFPDQPVSISDFINRFTSSGVPAPEEEFIVLDEQAQFQERAAALVEALPELTRSTSLPGAAVVFGEQLSRRSEDFEDTLAAEARRSESIFAGLFGNVQNPEFEGA